MSAVRPPGWPAQVHPPESPDFERTAVGWLLDQCPPDYRAYEVLRRYPVILARFAADIPASAHRDIAAWTIAEASD